MSNIVGIIPLDEIKELKLITWKHKKPVPSREEAYQLLLAEAQASSQQMLLPNNHETWQNSAYEIIHSGMLKLSLEHLFSDSRTTAKNRDELTSWIFSPLVEPPIKPVAFSFQACCGIESKLQRFASEPVDPAALQRFIADKIKRQHDGYEPLADIMAWFTRHNDEFKPDGKHMQDIHEAF